jgi:23S rRNA pseudouridine2605 synthase
MASRREAERWISEGRVSVNGQIITQLGVTVDPTSDSVALDGKSLVRKKVPPRVYWALHKPDLILTSRTAAEGSDKDTIYDLPKLKKLKFLVSPVGRLDYRTEGLLLLTNDGELANRLCRPEYKVPRTYQALVSDKLTKTQLAEIRRGVNLEDAPVTGIEIEFIQGSHLGTSTGSWYSITVCEGRNRLVRRIFEHYGLKTIRLIRISYGKVRLTQALAIGDYRQLTLEEITGLKKAVGLQGKGVRKTPVKPAVKPAGVRRSAAKPKKSAVGKSKKSAGKPIVTAKKSNPKTSNPNRRMSPKKVAHETSNS